MPSLHPLSGKRWRSHFLPPSALAFGFFLADRHVTLIALSPPDSVLPSMYHGGIYTLIGILWASVVQLYLFRSVRSLWLL